MLSFLRDSFPKLCKKAPILSLLKNPFLTPTRKKLLPCVMSAKILERHLNSKLLVFLDKNEALDGAQYGFRRNHSTESALIVATEEIRSIVDSGRKAVGVLLDFSAAFDTVSHTVLVDHLDDMGIGGSALDLLCSFLCDIGQSVYLGEYTSKSFSLPCGIPQTSSLSPTLFNTYVVPLARLISSAGFSTLSYADVTQIDVSISSDGDDTGKRFNNCMS